MASGSQTVGQVQLVGHGSTAGGAETTKYEVKISQI